MDGQAHEDESVRLALVLKPEARSEAGRTSVARIAVAMGLEETGRGLASLSFRVASWRFEELFHARVLHEPATLDELETVTRPGDRVDREPEVPFELAGLVDAVAVEPPLAYLGPASGPAATQRP